MKPTPLVIMARILARRRGEEAPSFHPEEVRAGREVLDAIRSIALVLQRIVIYFTPLG